MAEVTEQRAGLLQRGVIQVLIDHPDGLHPREVFREVARQVPPTPYEAADYPNRPGVRRYENLIRFRTISLVKAGWMVKDAGVWTVTDEGRRAYAALTDPLTFRRESTRLYKVWRSSQPRVPVTEADELEDDETTDVAALEEAEDSAWGEIEAYLAGMQPYDFQDLVAALLRAMGYHVSWVAPPGADGGLDILAFTDPLGAKGPRIKVQVKRHVNRVDPKEIRSFIGVLSDDDVGIYVSSGGYTREAESEARKQERKKLVLLDLRKLYQLWVEHYATVAQADRALLPLRTVYYLDRR
jgi:restriction system protein